MSRFQLSSGLISLLLLFWLAGLTAAAWAGTEKYDYDPLGRLIRYINPSGLITHYVYDGAGNILEVKTGLQPQPPVINSVSPTQIRQGETRQITLAGDLFSGASVSTADQGFNISGLQITNKQINFNLGAEVTAVLGNHAFQLSNSEGAANFTIKVNPALPKLAISPLPIAIPPNNTAYKFIVRLSNADSIDHSISLSLADTNIAQLSSTAVSIPAGTTEVITQITGKTGGVTSLSASAPGLQTIVIPVYVTADYAGINIAYALNVGVLFESAAPPPSNPNLSLLSPLVGVSRGPLITGISPSSLSIGSGPASVVVSGAGLENVTGIDILPSTGLTLGSITTATDGKSVTVPVTVAADAPITQRQIILSGANKPYLSAKPGLDRLNITLPTPILSSIEPLVGVPGSSNIPFTVRGKNLGSLVSIQFSPADGIIVGASPVVSAAGDAATTPIQIVTGAPIGDRLVTVTAPGGTSAATADASNTFRVVNEITQIVTPVSSPLLGLLKQQAATGTAQSIITQALPVGVSRGPVASAITPQARSIGDSFTLNITGNELAGITAVQLSPSTGLTIGTPNVSADGKTVSVSVSIDANAPQTVRQVIVMAGGSQVPFTPPGASQFQVASKLPGIDSVDPLYLLIGGAQTTMTVRGVNLQNAQEVKSLPPDGMIIDSSPVVNSDGTALTVGIQAASNAAPGSRTLVVVTPAGQTSNSPGVANTITLTSTGGTLITPISSPLLGVNKLSPSGSISTEFGPFISPLLGVVLDSGVAPPPSVLPIITLNPNLGVTYGPIALTATVDTPIRGSSGTLTVTGFELDGVNKITVSPAQGITVGSPVTVSADGKQASVPISFASTASRGLHKLAISVYSAQIPFVRAGADTFFLTDGLPQIDSIDPIVAHKGDSVTMIIRGQHLTAASDVQVVPGDGVIGVAPPQVNAAGTELTVNLTVSSGAATGARVIRVVTPAGTSAATANPSNTFTIVQ